MTLFIYILIRRIRLRRIARVAARELHGFLLAVLAVPLVGDDHGHHFVGAGPDRGEADVAVDAPRCRAKPAKVDLLSLLSKITHHAEQKENSLPAPAVRRAGRAPGRTPPLHPGGGGAAPGGQIHAGAAGDRCAGAAGAPGQRGRADLARRGVDRPAVGGGQAIHRGRRRRGAGAG